MSVVAFPGAANEGPEDPKPPLNRNDEIAKHLEILAAKIRRGDCGELLRCHAVFASLNQGQKATQVASMSDKKADWPLVYMDLMIGATQIQEWYPG